MKWDEISSSNNKLVENLSSTQERLINGLEKIIKNENQYLLDGHFCLLNSLGVPCRIDEQTFDTINPKAISIVIDDVHKIARRLEARDQKRYSIDALDKFQQMEIEYAKYLSEKYSIPYIEIINSDYKSLLKLIR